MSEREDIAARGPHSSSGYMTGLVIGMALSVVFGLLIFENLALGFLVVMPGCVVAGLVQDSRRKAREQLTEKV